jgi:adenosylhomocysteine nucleosidase
MQLFLASTALEFRGFLKRCTRVRVEPLRVVWARSGMLQGRAVLMLANGAGAGRAYAAIEAARERNPVLICNVGFCGALDPHLRVGEIVVATSTNGDVALLPRSKGAHVTGPLVCADHVVEKVREKRELRDAGFSAVDMESAGALRRARELGIPFYAVKAVSDLASDELRCDYNRVLRDDGSIDLVNLSLQAVARPFTCLPDLIRFGKNALFAAERMGEFLASCEF